MSSIIYGRQERKRFFRQSFCCFLHTTKERRQQHCFIVALWQMLWCSAVGTKRVAKQHGMLFVACPQEHCSQGGSALVRCQLQYRKKNNYSAKNLISRCSAVGTKRVATQHSVLFVACPQEHCSQGGSALACCQLQYRKN